MSKVTIRYPVVRIERDAFRVDFNFTKTNGNKIISAARYKEGIFWPADDRDIPGPFLHAMRRQAYAVYRSVFFGVRAKKKARKPDSNQLNLF